jgi:sugar phosphate isomerase/epimerase
MHLDEPAPPSSGAREALLPTLGRLEQTAAACDVRIGLELTRDYDLAQRDETPNVGLTLDVGHVSFDAGAGYREFGSLAGLVHHIGRRLFHVHMHDFDGTLDHLPLGAGDLDAPALIEALRGIDYEGVLCLELNPDRASPEQLLASRDRLEALLITP